MRKRERDLGDLELTESELHEGELREVAAYNLLDSFLLLLIDFSQLLVINPSLLTSNQ